MSKRACNAARCMRCNLAVCRSDCPVPGAERAVQQKALEGIAAQHPLGPRAG